MVDWRMDENFDNPGLLERLSLIIALVFLPLSLISAAIYPVKGFPLYSKGILAGLVFLGIYASSRKQRSDRAAGRRRPLEGKTPTESP